VVDRTPLQLPPGVSRKGSEAEVGRGRWYEANLVRWVDGVMRPVGGWEQLTLTGAPITSTIRAMHIWRDSETEILYTAVLCDLGLYVYDTGGFVQDITPVGGITSPNYSTIGGYGDFEYSDYANPDFGPNLYDTPRPDREDVIRIGEMWSLDNWGNDLIALASSDKRLLRWKPSDPPGTLATAVPNAPLGGRFFLITPERHLMLFGFGDKFNMFGWCSQENIEDWTFDSVSNSASFYELQPASPFVTAIVVRGSILLFTSNSAYVVSYVGTPYFYSYQYLGKYNAPVNGNAIAPVSGGAMWYASDGFWLFDGASIQTVTCDVLDYIQRLIDPIWQYRRTTAVLLGSQSEVWFFFPDKGQLKGTEETSRYAAYNFDEKWWTTGKLSRTCGVSASAATYPLMAKGTIVYRHEKGLYYGDAEELPYAQTGAINIAAGGRITTARSGIVDTRAPAGDVQFMITAHKDRIADGSGTPDKQFGLIARRDGGKLDFRVTGRDIVVRIQSARNGVEPWTFGQMLLRLFPRGAR
jgi:hypothetical protein